MKVLKSERTKEMAAELFALISQRKEIERREKELKDYFKSTMAEHTLIRAGDYSVILKDAVTSSIDRKALIAAKGEQFVAGFTKETHYQKVEIVKDSVAS